MTLNSESRFHRIYIISPETQESVSLHHQLMEYGNLSMMDDVKGIKRSHQKILILVNIESLSLTDISNISQAHSNAVIAFIFVDDTRVILPYLCIKGVNGLFFRHERKEIFDKGIDLLEKGEMFYPRDLLPELVNHIKLDTHHSANQLQSLSGKEHEILHLLSGGYSNRAMAEKLNLSFHTVKTHVYNIYKKLEVKNRAEAIHVAKSVLVQGGI